MMQSFVTLLLIPCLLLNQSAAFSHSHGDFIGEGHGTRAHIHLAGKSSTAGHDDKHDHSHHGHLHHEYGHGHSHSDKHKDAPKAPPSKTVKNDSCSPPYPHDADCVYIADVGAAALDRTSLEDFQFDTLHSCVLISRKNPNLQLRTHEKWSDWPPLLLFGSCPIYLRNLSLLI